jgi:hypothetical protein
MNAIPSFVSALQFSTTPGPSQSNPVRPSPTKSHLPSPPGKQIGKETAGPPKCFRRRRVKFLAIFDHAFPDHPTKFGYTRPNPSNFYELAADDLARIPFYVGCARCSLLALVKISVPNCYLRTTPGFRLMTPLSGEGLTPKRSNPLPTTHE